MLLSRREAFFSTLTSAEKNAPRWLRQLALIGKRPAAKTPVAAAT